MPILVRPVREQLEHDRVIRLLEAKYRRKFHVDINPGDERKAPVKAGPVTLFPDLVLSDESGRKPYAVVEVETGESVNHLEAMSQWANLAKSKAYLYLYVPAGSVDSAKRLCADHQITVTELSSYLSIGDQVRFTTVTRVPTPEPIEKRKAVDKAPEKIAEKVEKKVVEKKLAVEKVVVVEKAAAEKAAPQKLTPQKLAGVPKSENGAKPDRVAKAEKAGLTEKAAKPEKPEKVAKDEKKAVAPAKRPAAATPVSPSRSATPAKRRPGDSATARRAAQPAKRPVVKRAAASRTTTRGATKRTPARAVKPQASKAARAQKRK